MTSANGWRCRQSPQARPSVTVTATEARLELLRGVGESARRVTVLIRRDVLSAPLAEAEEQALRVCEAFAEVLNRLLPSP